MKTCILCGKNPRELPDRNIQGRPIKRVCRECHAGRLRGDIVTVLEANKPKKDTDQ